MHAPSRHGPAAAAAVALVLALAVDSGQVPAQGAPETAPPQSAPAGALTLDIRGGRLGLRADGVPLGAILERLAAATGIVVHGKGPGDERVTVTLENVTVEQALRRLLRGYSAVLVFDDRHGVPSALYLLSRRGDDSPAPAAETDATPLVEVAGDPEAGAVEELDRRVREEMQALQDQLQELGQDDPRQASHRLQELALGESPPARIEALHRLVGGEPSALIAALAAALRDPGGTVQAVATQLLLDLRVDEHVVAELVAAAARDEGAARLLLAAVLQR